MSKCELGVWCSKHGFILYSHYDCTLLLHSRLLALDGSFIIYCVRTVEGALGFYFRNITFIIVEIKKVLTFITGLLGIESRL